MLERTTVGDNRPQLSRADLFCMSLGGVCHAVPAYGSYFLLRCVFVHETPREAGTRRGRGGALCVGRARARRKSDAHAQRAHTSGVHFFYSRSPIF